MEGSGDMEWFPLAEIRARQEGELATSHALASMEYALAHEAFQVGVALRQSGIAFDPLTFIALRILEAGAEELIDLCGLLSVLLENGSLERSVEIAMDLLDRDAAWAYPAPRRNGHVSVQGGVLPLRRPAGGVRASVRGPRATR